MTRRMMTVLLGIAAICIGAAAPKRFHVSVEGPIGVLALPRDTLTYTLRWGKATNATSYKVTVTATATPAGTTTGLPVALVVTDTTLAFSAVNLLYDSIAFTATVTAWRGTLTNTTPATVKWSVAKKVGPPGPIQVDSTLIPPVVTILPSGAVMVASMRNIHAMIRGVETLQWTSHDTTITYNCGVSCKQVTSWECPVYPPGSPFGSVGPPGCYPGFLNSPPPLTVWQRVKDWFSPTDRRPSLTELVGRIG